MLRIAIAGAAGRMGRNLVRAVIEGGPDICLSAATVEAGDPVLGTDVGLLAVGREAGVVAADSLARCEADFDVLIDFTSPQALAGHAAHCRERGAALVVGTTGLGPGHHQLLAAAAENIAVLHAPNMSVGVNLSLSLLKQAAAALGDDFDVEIVEAHHRHKKDAPSGTALAMGRAVAESLGRDLDACAVYGREGIGDERSRETIGFATIRGGDIVGEHTVIFAGPGERLEISHKASSRMTFAQGALRAARWLAPQPPALYTMRDVLK
ncbi:MAG: 4-hydroxy-tetrahydrodipicolinate reductase [Gammaproteobacteria bacterium]|nr:4-hydroxy-tetrahydrodipicolinate reductase [Gammaproteobacteria bacterium]